MGRHAASPLVAQPRAAVVLSGRVSGLPVGATVTLLARAAGEATFRPVTALTPVRGQVSAMVRPGTTTEYQLAYEGTTMIASAQVTVRVLVRRGVVLSGVSPSVTRSASVGRRISLTAVLTPAAPDVVVTFRVYRYDPARRAYRQVAAVGRTSVGGRAAWTWRPTSAGRYYLRLTTPPTTQFANGISAAYRWVIVQ